MRYVGWCRPGLLAMTLFASSPAAADPRGWDRASGIGRDLLVASALGVPAVRGDSGGGGFAVVARF